MEIPVIYQDENILVINKPTGVVVTPGAGYEESETLVGWLIGRLGEQLRQVGSGGHRPGIVHRLDKDTSGVMVIAKTQDSFLHLVDQFKTKKVKKYYSAWVWGDVNQTLKRKTGSEIIPSEFVINAPIGRNPRDRMKFAVTDGGKEAITKFSVEKIYQPDKNHTITFLNCFPSTGRTHQIRVHIKSFGHSIVGDILYQNRNETKSFKTLIKNKKLARRLYLHSYKLEIKVPNGQMETFVADIPKEMLG